MFRAIMSACVVALCLWGAPAQAAHRHHRHHHHHHHRIHHARHHRAAQPVQQADTNRTPVASLESRPAECPPVLWCGCYLATKMGFHGRTWRELWVAKAWARVGSPAPHGCVDCVAVFSRRGGGHVGIVKSWDSHGNPIVLSGNYNNRVATAPHSAARLIALRYI